MALMFGLINMIFRLGSAGKQKIRRAIQQGLLFLACFSKEYHERDKTYMIEELTMAIDELRQRPSDRAWFIPVKLNECEIPDIDIGRSETLQDLQYVALYEDWDVGVQRVLSVIQPKSTKAAMGGDTAKKQYTSDKQHVEPKLQDHLQHDIIKKESVLDYTRRNEYGVSKLVSRTFCSNIQVQDNGTISTRYKNITRRLNTDFWNTTSDTSHSLYVGSYGRNTAIEGFSDLDMIFELPYSVYQQYNEYEGNGQSALLQAVKKSIEKLMLLQV